MKAPTYEELVELCLESNYDQSDYDEASAMAAVDSMLDDESGSYTAVYSRLMGDTP